jgi:hypothetical protein
MAERPPAVVSHMVFHAAASFELAMLPLLLLLLSLQVALVGRVGVQAREIKTSLDVFRLLAFAFRVCQDSG